MSYITIEQLGNLLTEAHFNFRSEMKDIKRENNYGLALMIYNELKSHSVKDIESFESNKWEMNFFTLQSKCPLVTFALLEINAFNALFSKEVKYLFSKKQELDNIFGEDRASDLILHMNNIQLNQKRDPDRFSLKEVIQVLFTESRKNDDAANLFIDFLNLFYSEKVETELFSLVKQTNLNLNDITLLNKTKFDFFKFKPNMLESIILSMSDFYGDKEVRQTKLNNIIFCIKLGLDCAPDIVGAKNWHREEKTFLEMLLERNWGEKNTLELLSLKNWTITEKSNEHINNDEHSKKVKDMYQVMKERNELEQSLNTENIVNNKKIKI